MGLMHSSYLTYVERQGHVHVRVHTYNYVELPETLPKYCVHMLYIYMYIHVHVVF